MGHKLTVVSVSMTFSVAIFNLAGCANFEDSFGELRGPDRQFGNVERPSRDNLERSHDRPDTESYRESSIQRVDQRSYSIAGVPFELDPGAVTQ
jgi:hypothetical protein